MIREANLHWQYQDTDTGLLMPWYTLPALEWLKKQDTSEWNIFEYGAGYSTIWWRLNSLRLYSVDHNEYWSKAMDALCCHNMITYVDYIEHVTQLWREEKNPFNCVIIDGEYRFECVKFSRDYIASGGYMIVDNYGQTDFPSAESIDALLEGWEKQVFKQPNHSDWCTAVFKKP